MAARLTAVTGPPTSLDSHMGPSDAVFWYAEELSPGLRSTIGGVLLLEGPPDFDRYRVETERALRMAPRLRQKIVDPPLRFMLPEWVEDPHFDLGYHLRHEALPAPGDDETLFNFISQVMSTPLDRARPQWETYAIEGLQGGKGAILTKMHHSMVDGVGSVSLLDTFTRKGPRARPQLRALAPVPVSKEPSSFLREAAFHPFRMASKAAAAARSTLGLLEDLQKKPISDPIAEKASGISRRIDHMSVSLKDLRRVHDARGATINDLVLTAVSGAFGRYHALRGVPVGSLRSMVPVSLRRDHERSSLGNRVGMLNVTLPVGEEDPDRRLSIIQRRTGRAKKDGRGSMYPYFMRLVTALPTFVFRAFVESTAGSVNLICTNIPGTPESRWLAGRRIETIIPIAPSAEKVPLTVALFSYVDTLGIGISTDPEAIPDHDKLKACLEDAFEEVLTMDGGRPRLRRKAARRRA